MSATPSDPAAIFASEDVKARYMAAYDAVLAKWPVEHEDIYVPTSLGPTHVIASGRKDAPPLILLHAALATAVIWRPNVEALSRDFRVYAVDVVGQGGKSVLSRQVKTRQDYADWMSELFDGLGIGKASIVGNSYGAWLAMNEASLAPERVDRVVAISPPGVFVSFGALARSYVFKMAENRVRRLFGGPPPRTLDMTFVLNGKGRFNPQDEDWLALGNQLLGGSVRPTGMIMPVVFSKKELASIRTPTLLLIAEYELLYEPQSTMALARKRMPGIEAEIVPDAHHLAAMAQPDVVNARIVAFLEGERAPGAADR